MMARSPLCTFAALALLGGCATSNDAPGTGWSRAPDISVYQAMTEYAGLAREQAVLCEGDAPAQTDAEWRAKYGARVDRITAALIARHGVLAAAPPAILGRQPCEVPFDDSWEGHHAKLLRLLEVRYFPYESTGGR